MMRFVDIRNQGVGYRFAFWNTTVDRFFSSNGEQAWDSLEELRASVPQDIYERLAPLCPDWVSDGKEDDVEAWYMGDT